MRTANIVDVLAECSYTLDFLSHSLSQTILDLTPDAMSYSAQTGLTVVLEYVKNRLDAATVCLANNRREMEVL